MFILGSLEVHSGLPISVNWTFFARCYGWGATNKYRLKIDVFAPTGSALPKILGRRGHPPPTILCVSKTRINVLSCGIKSGQKFLLFYHNPRVWHMDGQTDSFLVAILHSMQCKQCHAMHAAR